MAELPEELMKFAEQLHKYSGRPLEKIIAELKETEKYDLTPIRLLKEFRTHTHLSLDTILGIYKDNYLGIKILTEDVKKRGGKTTGDLVLWEKLEKSYKEALDYIEKKGWVETRTYQGQKFYIITSEGKKHYDAFFKHASHLIIGPEIKHKES
ncbi:hypothetical protein AYK26_07085 [Euryarchaeota archaeon SM23-78]|nr:MAG: hypothetical protein AYK26_07085 [Euryarchaeota archaeon SM23-78]MBW3000778.1 hypothetical protein [Candidatus Woesearchaeota archaeon]